MRKITIIALHHKLQWRDTDAGDLESLLTKVLEGDPSIELIAEEANKLPIRALVGRDEQVFASAGAFEPALAAQRLDDLVDRFGTSAEQFNNLFARDASQAALTEAKHDPAFLGGTMTGRETPSHSPALNPLRKGVLCSIVTS